MTPCESWIWVTYGLWMLLCHQPTEETGHAQKMELWFWWDIYLLGVARQIAGED